MTEHENRKHAAIPSGYKASYGQNGITYHQVRDSRRSHPFPWAVVIVGLLLVALFAAAVLNVTIFEDGSFRLFTLTGCLPGGICN